MGRVHTIENTELRIALKHKGAELSSIADRGSGREYMWTGKPTVWAGQAPVLFPNIGVMRERGYEHRGKSYRLPKHGFIRHAEDLTIEVGADYLRASLSANERTRALYPFEFDFAITYRLMGRTIVVEHEVVNRGEEAMPFSLGGHPAFRVPLNSTHRYEEYGLRFAHFETAPSRLVTESGLIANEWRPGLEGWVLPLRHELFAQDALVLSNHRSRRLSLVHREEGQVLSVHFEGWPYLGIWAKPEGDFVCIEPWLGLSDVEGNDYRLLADKRGMLILPPGEVFRADYKIVIA